MRRTAARRSAQHHDCGRGPALRGRLLTQAGKEADGAYVTYPLTPPDRTGTFATACKARYGTSPPFWGPEAFDAANILLAGIAADRATRAGMLTWVHEFDGDGVSRHISFNADGDLDAPQVWFHRVVDGAFRADSVIPDR